MEKIIWNSLSEAEQRAALERPAERAAAEIKTIVAEIGARVKEEGDRAVIALTEQFDQVTVTDLSVGKEAFIAAESRLSSQFKQAIERAYRNIKKFHEAQKQPKIAVETEEGVYCEVLTRAIESVGLYIPGGTAPLFSTVLMLAIPAKIAGCGEIVLASPPPIADEILYAAQLCGIDKIYQMGGAQAIFALGLGSESVIKVDKIFGPGNSFVTEAKRQISQMPGGAAIDMPAGPSEVLIIADQSANPAFVAADLLSQAEHGADSQVILVTPSAPLIDAVEREIEKQLQQLGRAETARAALQHSRSILVDDLTEAVAVSNRYAPEHLIIQTENAEAWVDQIMHAGSLFLGAYSPESMGDYASGTNHVLPTYGYARTYSSLGLADFSKRMTVQRLTKEGFSRLGPTVALLAEKEQLDAHKLAVEVRLQALAETFTGALTGALIEEERGNNE
ncbi:histidinol dehydrogenase [Ignatzschineria cameli]|uniref:Histidinol dehydrogenase n=1 Tax=Ignatzschineria cameli TaxID=2182793 RepID=A0A2U2ATT8_9GAMM|nr:histidinol dehydrogenase [Ignatzschineria cameli]PWD88106.1 histidinol dehydrogenase [Ignatzschineria cameli]PWD91137.1 histidinol dehydrogenase [Ignatzschineria cameli]PWD92778.1 histidinol dehydrogenase [Ignatzschineria cameli]PWD93799.1 histidinol dehydrogenase [Ignatzschineria cameli]